jgi:hypothetical protein
MSKSTMVVLLALLLVTNSLVAPGQDRSRVVTAFKRLQVPATTDRAANELLALGRADTEARKFLSANLPTLIDRGPAERCRCWQNEVSLAGNLKIVEVAKPLSKWITVREGVITFTSNFRLENAPAAKALAQIGDPAIPTIQNVLLEDNVDRRGTALMILSLMHTPKARLVLKDHLEHEQDDKLRDYIVKTLDNWKE